jgi:hypothetical protein
MGVSEFESWTIQPVASPTTSLTTIHRSYISVLNELNNQSSELTVQKQAIPLQDWAGHEASRSLRLPDFKTIGT